jgi:hypothetical protein
MYGTCYVPPSSPAEVSLNLEYSLELSLNYNADAVILVGDFNNNQFNSQCRKVKDIMRLFNLHQLINEATTLTEHSQSLINLVLTNNPSFIIYTEVGTALTDHTRFHCPTYDIFNCIKTHF